MNRRNFEARKYAIGIAASLVVAVYIVRLFSLQVVSDDFKKNADSNAFLKRVLYPSRGVISDRNGKLLVYNQAAYDIMVVMNEINDLDTLDFCQTLGITPAYFNQRMRDIKDRNKNVGYSRFTQQIFLNQLSAEDFSTFQEKMFRFQGFYIQRRSIRQYEYNYAAHVLGDVGEVSKNDIKEDSYYQSGDYIGKLGVESSYEKHLRGEKGVQILLRDAHGRIQGQYMEGEYDSKPIAGKNLTLSLEVELQALGEHLMQNKIGSIVAIEPATGEILCMVSSPTYDPHTMIGRQRGANHHAMSLDPMKPLFNRSIMGQYPPGSTFKISQALTFLQEGIITPSTSYSCSHGFVYAGLRVGCHPHSSPLPLIPAIATSCNSYFCNGFYRMINARQKYGSVQKSMNTWRNYMVSMGFGYPLGIDLPGEKRGLIPNAEYYDRNLRGSWNGLTVISVSIGQGEVNTTPLQIANFAATIANRGFYYIPHVVKEIEDGKIDSIYSQPKYTIVDTQHYEVTVQGMRAAVTDGTCRAANIPGIEVCGKTGTAQNKGQDHSIFMGFAPMNNPKIAIGVYVENGGFGATFAVPIGALMMEQYLNGKLTATSQEKADYYANRTIEYGTVSR